MKEFPTLTPLPRGAPRSFHGHSRDFSDCLADADSNLDATVAESVLASAQENGDCSAILLAPAKPQIRTTRNNIVFDVDRENDALFRRTRQTTLSIFEMNEQLQAVAATLSGQTSTFAMQRDIISNITAATGVALSRQVSDGIATTAAAAAAAQAQASATIQTALSGFSVQLDNLW